MNASEDVHRGIVQGVAAIAVTAAEMGATEEEARQQLALWLIRLEVQSSAALREAAAAIALLPQLVDEAAERLERGRPIRELLVFRRRPRSWKLLFARGNGWSEWPTNLTGSGEASLVAACGAPPSIDLRQPSHAGWV